MRRLEVAIGGRYGARVEIVSGLSVGDRVVYSGTVNLQDMSKISVMVDRPPPARPEELLAFLKKEPFGDGEGASDGPF